MTTDTATLHDTAVDADHDDDELELSEEELEALAEEEAEAFASAVDNYFDGAVELFVESFYWWKPERIVEAFTGIDLSRANEETEYDLNFEVRDASVNLVGTVTFTEREEWNPPQPGDDDYDEDEDYEEPEPEVWSEEVNETLVNFSAVGSQGILSVDQAEVYIGDAFTYSDKRFELARLREEAVECLTTRSSVIAAVWDCTVPDLLADSEHYVEDDVMVNALAYNYYTDKARLFRTGLLSMSTQRHLSGQRESVAAVARYARDPELLQVLTQDTSAGLRELVASNMHLSVPALVAMSEDEDEDVRAAVATNANAPSSVLEALSKDDEEAVRLAVAGHLNTPPSIVAALYNDEVEEVRDAAMANRRDEVVQWMEEQGLESAADIPEEWLGLIFG